jgi:hypothetical protein
MANSATSENRTYNIDTTTRDYDKSLGEPNISQSEDKIKATYDSGVVLDARNVLSVSDIQKHVEYNSGVCTSGNITVADILNLNTIRGGCKMTCGCGMKGGCLTCKDGVKNITHIYKTVHIIIPELYSKYNSDLNIKKKSIKVKKNKKGK